jgi:hypothetical protein
MISSNPNRLLRNGLLGFLLFLAPSAATFAVHPWETVEITLSASSVPADPYAGEQVWVDLAGPGFSNRCYGFWDGGNEKRQIELSTDSASPNTVRWFDPRRGEFAGPAVAWGAESRILPPRPAPADEDWLLLVKTTK